MKNVNFAVKFVLERLRMRGVFTSGVLDAFMRNDLQFRYIVAVSAGACMACRTSAANQACTAVEHRHAGAL